MSSWSNSSRLACLASLLFACLLVAGCGSVPRGDLESLASRRNPPDIRDIDKLERDRAVHVSERTRIHDELAELRQTAVPSESTQYSIDYRERRKAELLEETRELEAREELILDRIAQTDGQPRRVFEQLDKRIQPLAARHTALSQELFAMKRQGKGDSFLAGRREAELAQAADRVQYYQEWQEKIASASGLFERSIERDWPVLDAAVRRRREARGVPSSGIPSPDKRGRDMMGSESE